MGACLCDKCAALCCRYFALPIDNPDCRKDYDNIRWYLIHQNVVVFIEKKQWYVGVLNRCKHLQDNNLCGIYDTRPAICRSYSTDNCDYHGGEYDYEKLFTSAEDLWDYALEQLAKPKTKAKKTQKRIPRNPSEPLPLRPIANAMSGSTPAPAIATGRRVRLPLL